MAAVGYVEAGCIQSGTSNSLDSSKRKPEYSCGSRYEEYGKNRQSFTEAIAADVRSGWPQTTEMHVGFPSLSTTTSSSMFPLIRTWCPCRSIGVLVTIRPDISFGVRCIASLSQRCANPANGRIIANTARMLEIRICIQTPQDCVLFPQPSTF